jgi:outer membrane lipoprotein SlyB
LAFDQIVINGREHKIRAMASEVFESKGIREEAATVGTAGAVGAIVGGIIGGVKGALIGAAVGSGGVIAATEGKDVELQPGTMIRIRLDEPVLVR